MFIILTHYSSDKKTIYRQEDIKKIEPYDDGDTKVVFDDGDCIAVKETVQEIWGMLNTSHQKTTDLQDLIKIG